MFARVVSFLSVVLIGFAHANLDAWAGLDEDYWRESGLAWMPQYPEISTTFSPSQGDTVGVAAVIINAHGIDSSDGYYFDLHVAWGGYGRSLNNGYSLGTVIDLTAKEKLDVANSLYSSADYYVEIFPRFEKLKSLPDSGDTLHWTVRLIYFDSKKVDLSSWSQQEPHWELSDTLVLQFGVVASCSYDAVGLEAQRSSSRLVTPILRLDLTGRPVGPDARGLVLERGPDGLWRRQVELE